MLFIHFATHRHIRIRSYVPIELSIVVMQQPIHCKPRTFKAIRIVPSEFGLDDCSRCLFYFPYQPIPSIYLFFCRIWYWLICGIDSKWNETIHLHIAMLCIASHCIALCAFVLAHIQNIQTISNYMQSIMRIKVEELKLVRGVHTSTSTKLLYVSISISLCCSVSVYRYSRNASL